VLNTLLRLVRKRKELLTGVGGKGEFFRAGISISSIEKRIGASKER